MKKKLNRSCCFDWIWSDKIVLFVFEIIDEADGKNLILKNIQEIKNEKKIDFLWNKVNKVEFAMSSPRKENYL